MGNRLYVGNLSFEADRDSVRSAFESVGEVTDVHVVTDRETGRSRGFAFVTMATDELAQEAIKRMDGNVVGGRPLRVNEATERGERGGGGGRGGFGGGGGRGGFGGGRGGGGQFDGVTLYTMRGGAPVALGEIPGGDRGDGGISDAHIEGGVVLVDRMMSQEGDGACCPSKLQQERWAWKGGAFVEDEAARRLVDMPQ